MSDPFEPVRARILREPGSEEKRAFAREALVVGGRIVALHHPDGMAVKLPAARCAEVVAAGDGEPLRRGDRPMREWVVVAPGRGDWVALAEESLAYVTAAG